MNTNSGLTNKDSAMAAAADMNSLSDEILLKIFAHLPRQSFLLTLNRVCRRWHKVTRDRTLWSRVSMIGRRSQITGTPQPLDVHQLFRLLARGTTHVDLTWRQLIDQERQNPSRGLVSPISFMSLTHLCLDYVEPQDKDTFAELLKIDRWPPGRSLTHLSLESCPLSLDLLNVISAHGKLKVLNLTSAHLGEGQLRASLTRLPITIEELNVSWIRADDDEVWQLLFDQWFPTASSQIRQLNCSGQRVLAAEHILEVLVHYEKLYELDLSDCYHMDDTCLDMIMSSFPLLEHLNVSRCYRLKRHIEFSLLQAAERRFPPLKSIGVHSLVEDGFADYLGTCHQIWPQRTIFSSIARPKFAMSPSSTTSAKAAGDAPHVMVPTREEKHQSEKSPAKDTNKNKKMKPNVSEAMTPFSHQSGIREQRNRTIWGAKLSKFSQSSYRSSIHWRIGQGEAAGLTRNMNF